MVQSSSKSWRVPPVTAATQVSTTSSQAPVAPLTEAAHGVSGAGP